MHVSLCLFPLTPSQQDRLNSKKHKMKDEKKPIKSASRDMVFPVDPIHYSSVLSQEPIDPLMMQKYTHRLYTEVCVGGGNSAVLIAAPTPFPYRCIPHVTHPNIL